MRILRKLANIGVLATLVCFAFVLATLTIIAATSTSVIEVLSSEKSYMLPDHPVLNVAAALGCGALLYVGARHPRLGRVRAWLLGDRGFAVARALLLAFLFALACAWVLLLRPLPGSDQEDVWRVARETLAGDWSELGRGGYLSAYPFQIGFVLVMRLFVRLFGDHAVLAYELFNVVGLVVVYATLASLMAHFGAGRLQQLLVIALGVVFFPLLQYVTFVYGTIWGLALALLSVRCAVGFFATGDVRSAVLSGVFIGLAILWKENNKIVLIALLLAGLVELVVHRKALLALLPCVLVVAFVLEGVAPRAYVERMSGMRMADGCSPWSYVAMGLQEVYADCGWFTEYNRRTYVEADEDATAQAQVAKKEIANTLEHFAQVPNAGVRFFARKVASQWNNPTFQGSWVVQVCLPQRPLGPAVRHLVGQRATDVAVAFLNLVQFTLLAGALAWVVLCRWDDERMRRMLVLPLTFVGGFLCHVGWEAKAQYTLPYFVMLLPLATMGYAQLVGLVDRCRRQGTSLVLAGVWAQRKVAVVTCAVACVAFALLCGCGLVSYLTSDSAEYAWYVAEGVPPRILSPG